MTSAVLIGWNRVHPSHHGHVDAVTREQLNYWEKAKRAGKIVDFEHVVLVPHGGTLNGFLLVRGDRKELDELLWDDEFLALTSRAQAVTEGLMIVRGVVGEAATQAIHAYNAKLATL
jgi:hypothetical protein